MFPLFKHSSKYPLIPSRMPVFGMRTRVLFSTLKDPIDVGHALMTDYRRALLKATLIAIGVNIVEINDTTLFVRDPAVILHNLNLIIYTKSDLKFGTMSVVHKAQEIMGFQPIEIEDAYFEGGNVLYAPYKAVLLHGINPGGGYKQVQLMKEITLEMTNARLADKLNQYGIDVVGLALNPKLVGVEQAEDYFYHLDCFMQLLPNGKVLILNKEILSAESQYKMQTLLGDDFIDLAYPDYLSRPCLLNFVSIEKNGKTMVVCPTLPPFVMDALTRCNLSVITPESLDVRSSRYDEDLSSRVVAALHQDGFETMTATNLATHVAKNSRGYLRDDGSIEDAGLRDIAVSENGFPIDYSYSNDAINFIFGDGGPHCLTSEIIPSSSIAESAKASMTSSTEYEFLATP